MFFSVPLGLRDENQVSNMTKQEAAGVEESRHMAWLGVLNIFSLMRFRGFGGTLPGASCRGVWERS